MRVPNNNAENINLLHIAIIQGAYRVRGREPEICRARTQIAWNVSGYDT